jgi:hypothetical protein
VATLPPVAISSFDDETGRFLTKASPGVPLRVEDAPPGLDAGELFPSQVSRPPGSRETPSSRTLAVCISAIGVIALGLFLVGTRLQEKLEIRSAHRRLIHEIIRRYSGADTDVERAQLVTQGLTDYLALSIERPNGVLTPCEAADAVALATGSQELADRAQRLIAWCDRTLYEQAIMRNQAAEPDRRCEPMRTFFLELLARTATPIRRRVESKS